MSPQTLALLTAFGSGLAFTLLGVMYKVAALRQARAMPFAAAFLVTAAMVSLGKALTEPPVWQSPALWLLGVGAGVSLYLGIALVMRANQLGPASVCWTLLNLSLIVPILAAPWLLGERLLWADAVTVGAFVLMLACLARGMAGGGETRPEHLLPYAGTVGLLFLVNGAFLLVSKLVGRYVPADSTASFATVFYAAGGVLALLTLLADRGRARLAPAEWQTGALAGLASSTGMLLVLASLRLPAAVLFPLSQGVALVGGVAITALLFKERLNPAKVAGLALGLVVLLAAGMREVWATLLARLP